MKEVNSEVGVWGLEISKTSNNGRIPKTKAIFLHWMQIKPYLRKGYDENYSHESYERCLRAKMQKYR
jgi:hypothetical protein